MYTIIFHCKTLQNFPQIGILGLKNIPSGNPALGRRRTADQLEAEVFATGASELEAAAEAERPDQRQPQPAASGGPTEAAEVGQKGGNQSARAGSQISGAFF
jgi:hypothetical protein